MKKITFLLVALFITSSISAQIIDIPDANFKNALVNTASCLINNSNVAQPADTNDDGEISVAEAEAVTDLFLANGNGNNISSLEGIEYFINLDDLKFDDTDLISIDLTNFSNLERLSFSNNNALNSVNITGMVNLDYFSIGSSAFTELDLSTNVGLTTIRISNSDLSNITFSPTNSIEVFSFSNSTIPNLDISSLTELFSIVTIDSQLNGLDLSAQSIIEKIWCSNSQLTELDLSSNPLLEELWCSNNQLTELDLSSNPLLRQLDCNNNLLASLDISNTKVFYLKCENNQLESLNVKNGVLNRTYCPLQCTSEFDFNNNPNLSYVCADDELFSGNSEINIVQNKIDSYGYTNCHVNSYCSFVLGGEHYTIEGNVKIDLDANSCDTNDVVFPNLNFTSTDGIETGNFISSTTGNYYISVQEGSHTITPNLENPDYFTINPTSVSVDFPIDTSPYLQDFCVTPNGTYNDLEITIIPLQAARPGFDTNYKVFYKNKGTTTLSGSIDLSFQDDLMDFVSASPDVDSQSANLLSWNFTDLMPFENREIDLTMNLNAPTDTPPLNDGDILTFNTSIAFSGTDETPEDNTFQLNQTLVNSFDPNDKTCLEGTIISPDMVGKDVHYMIRFENTGTANAVNIVVKDNIDITEYDLSTLIPLHASHDYIARIKDQGNDHYIEFIFEGINLPFDDANNDGFIVFKIKTLDTLELGDTFENEAEIYFDFNFPIITDISQTTVATLSTDEFALESSISIFPNPTSDELNIKSKGAIQSIKIYDLLGRTISSKNIKGYSTTIVLSLKNVVPGTYFIKVYSEGNEVVKQLIKN